MPAGRVIISVTSDLVTDQRVHRTALTLHNKGLKVKVIGRRKKTSGLLRKNEYDTLRFSLWWEKGALFYAAYNTRLFFYLLFHKCEVLIANDLDTLLPNYLISQLKNIPLYYDSHEYFTGVPELMSRPLVRSVWKKIERFIFPKLKNVFTVNDSIAGLYSKEYGNKVGVIRNLPFRNPDEKIISRAEYNLPSDKKIFLFQGAGINIDRGAEEAIEAIRLVENAALLFIGGGDVTDKLKRHVAENLLSGKVFFIPRQPMNILHRFTGMADFGLSLDKDTNINYRFSLPNKLFDYIQAGLPVLVTDLPEVKKITEGFNIGLVTSSVSPEILAGAMRSMMADTARLELWKRNVKIAADELCWEKEEIKFSEIFKDVIA